MYPTGFLKQQCARDGSLIRRIWEFLNQLPEDKLLGEGRVYGGGLHKLEPRELGNVPVSQLFDLLPKEQRPSIQTETFDELTT